jgi:UDP-N-acetylmuramoyl-tripeptide--D-alanyl-D-alanine ligase
MTTEQLYQVYLKHPIVCTDTRKITDSCLFFGLKGDNFNGNQFALQAIESGAAFAIVDQPEYAINEQFILVPDVLESLQNLARLHRKHLKIPVIGITGSNGKTTSKELLNSVLSQKFKTFATEGNLNNHIGVPLSLLSVSNDCEIAIIEMGANHQKEIELLSSISQPSHGMITNVGKAHLEGFGGLEGVKIGKGELFQYLSDNNGIVFINNDNSTLKTMAQERKVKNIISYGQDDSNFLSVQLKNTSPFLSVEWKVEGTNKHLAHSNLPGTYNFENIAAAICFGAFFKLSPEQINKGISDYKPVNYRSQILKTEKNIIICDYYNANPSSMIVALENLEDTEANSKVLILGDMFELGVESAKEHQLILEKALSTKANRRILIGEEFFKLHSKNGAEFYKNTADVEKALQENPIEGSTVLLKGSRGMKLEILLNSL